MTADEPKLFQGELVAGENIVKRARQTEFAGRTGDR